MKRETNREITISKMQNVFMGLKFKYPNGVYASELKNTLKKLEICSSSNYMSSYIKAGLLQKVSGGSKTKYFFNSDINKINKWYDDNHKSKSTKKEDFSKQEEKNKIQKYIDYLINHGYFIQKLTEDVKIIIIKNNNKGVND